MAGMHWNLEEDRKTVTLTLPTEPPVQIKFDVAGVDEVLAKLGEFRGGMLPEVPWEYVFG